MVDKMPMVAYKALDQFHLINRAKRQQLFYLDHLEPDPEIDEANFLSMSVLGSVSFISPLITLQSCTQIIRPLAHFYSYDYDLRKTNYIFK